MEAPAQSWQQYSIKAGGRFIEINANHKKRHFIEQIKALIFLEAVLTIKAMSEPHSNLQEIDIPNIIKDKIS